jgi:hypothetical protein
LRIYGGWWWIGVRSILLLAIIFSLSASVLGFYYLQQVSYMKGMEEFASVPPLYEAFMSQAREVSLEELKDIMKSYGFDLLVPHYIPDGIKLSAVYYKCCPLVVIIAYSDRGVKDYRFANIAIEIIPFDPVFAPSEEYLQRLNNPPKQYVVRIRDFVAVITPETEHGNPELRKLFGPYPMAIVWHNGLQYIIAIKRPLTVEDLHLILNSLNPA